MKKTVDVFDLFLLWIFRPIIGIFVSIAFLSLLSGMVIEYLTPAAKWLLNEKNLWTGRVIVSVGLYLCWELLCYQKNKKES